MSCDVLCKMEQKIKGLYPISKCRASSIPTCDEFKTLNGSDTVKKYHKSIDQVKLIKSIAENKTIDFNAFL